MNPPSASEIRLYLNRILNSSPFTKADRLRNILRFLVEETLAGRHAELKEYTIATRICGRPPGFDPKTDPVVRVDANRLRARLQDYYAGQGRHDTVAIDLPKGSYVPAFRRAAQPETSGDLPAASLVVLPFLNLAPDTGGDYLSDGLTDELIHQLARIPQLRVVARTSAFQYKGKSADVRKIARHLAVGHVLEGSVRSAPGRIRVTAQLSEGAGGCVVWSAKYERRAADLFAIEDDICAAITGTLRVRLLAPAAGRRTANIEAHHDYLEGRYHWNRRTPEALEKSIACYRAAIQRDPDYPLPYAGLADTFLVQCVNDWAASRERMPPAKECARKALDLAPECGEALTSLACVQSIYDWDWIGAEEGFRRALDCDAGLANAHYLYAMVNLAPRGRFPEALAHMSAALRCDPVSHLLRRDTGVIHYLAGDYRAAEAELLAARELDPPFPGPLYWLGRTLAEQGRLDEALAVLDARWRAGQTNTRALAAIGHLHGIAGRTEAARRTLSELRRISRRRRVPPLDFAVVQMGLGDLAAAFQHLSLACSERSAALYQFAVDPLFAPARRDRRAVEILDQMNLGPVALVTVS